MAERLCWLSEHAQKAWMYHYDVWTAIHTHPGNIHNPDWVQTPSIFAVLGHRDCGASAPVSPIEGLAEEAGGSIEPAAAGVVLGCGTGDGAGGVPLGAFFVLWEVVW